MSLRAVEGVCEAISRSVDQPNQEKIAHRAGLAFAWRCQCRQAKALLAATWM
jgi:hypothetical protein